MVRYRIVNLLVIGLLAAAAFFLIYSARDLHFQTAYAFAAVLLLLSFGTLLEVTTARKEPATGNRPWKYKASGLLFLACFFYFFVRGLMLWGDFSTLVFQSRLLIFAVTGAALMGLLHLYHQFWPTTEYQQRLHANTFYFGLIFLMSAGMMKYRDPSRVDGIGTVSISLFCLLEAVALLKRK